VKIFIIYASAGFGHQKVAEAINEAAVDIYGKNNVKLFDILDYTSPLFKKIYSKGYLFAISKLSWIWAILFFISDTKYLRFINVNFRRFVNSVLCSRFLNYIREETPDVVISTHFLVNELVSHLKEKGSINTKLISVVTDFGVHNFWLADNVNYYVAATDLTKKIIESKGIARDKIRVFGIPVRKQFKREIDVASVKAKFDINNQGFTALILTGGVGIGPIEEIVELLAGKCNIIAICGKNKDLLDSLNSLKISNLVVLGWVDNVEDIMTAADIIITKPGGSSISESIVRGLPMIFFSIIPGQEAQNARIITESGLGYIIRKPKDIAEKVQFFKENKDKLLELRDKICAVNFADSTSKILDLLND